MRSEYAARYVPTSPLSPKIASSQGHLSPTMVRQPVGSSKSSTRKFHMQLPIYGYDMGDRSASASPTSRVQSPAINLLRAPQPTPMDSQRSMGKGQRDLIRQLKLSSQLAASSAAHRPDAPRLDPLGSPKGPVTPLALEQHEASDYFALATSTRYSPAVSPSGCSSRSDSSDKEKQKKKKKHRSDLYQ